jgi:hypothetical protein
MRTTIGAPATIASTPGTASPPHPRAQGLRVSRVFFEYVGRTGLTVVGSGSGRRYRFDRPGARLEVDLKDRASLAGVPHLRQVVPG